MTKIQEMFCANKVNINKRKKKKSQKNTLRERGSQKSYVLGCPTLDLVSKGEGCEPDHVPEKKTKGVWSKDNKCNQGKKGVGGGREGKKSVIGANSWRQGQTTKDRLSRGKRRAGSASSLKGKENQEQGCFKLWLRGGAPRIVPIEPFSLPL